ncbi:hypothetical protein KOR42_34220 [Thalassoglobus neptunius]|uniref:VWFA domain-containing protein n=1 Tax=Thalassoglobus neptunius TaxID=1938619 RepID=A0A5C5WNG0_9PLAN|nr:VWA domain-containing protein [Thalassoglobus neptunius]TWT51735.1 hypothetical protein KOR42_34220 [Thalassoglobus neptunius]
MNNPSKLRMTTLLMLLLAMMISGCGAPRDKSPAAEPQVFQGARPQSRNEPATRVVMILMDLSGSFTEKMANDGEAYQFALNVIDQYFRSQSGTNDNIVLAQISGTRRSLLWEGSPRQLRETFPSADSFREFLLSNADPRGSLVHEGMRNAIDYLTHHSVYGTSNAKTVTLVLSDMDDTSFGDSEERLNKSLVANAHNQGAIGIYFCNQLTVEDWKQRLASAGYINYVVESEIVGKPQLPKFEVFPRTVE